MKKQKEKEFEESFVVGTVFSIIGIAQRTGVKMDKAYNKVCDGEYGKFDRDWKEYVEVCRKGIKDFENVMKRIEEKKIVLEKKK